MLVKLLRENSAVIGGSKGLGNDFLKIIRLVVIQSLMKKMLHLWIQGLARFQLKIFVSCGGT